ncbi:MAG: 4-hydroxyphenylacetate permease, partial [Janthinobacterium sp.]
KANWLSRLEQQVLARMLAAEHKPVAAHGAPQQKVSVLAEMLSPTVLKFGIAYFCLVNTLAMVAVWTPLIVKSFSGDASNTQIGLLAAIPQVCTV